VCWGKDSFRKDSFRVRIIVPLGISLQRGECVGVGINQYYLIVRLMVPLGAARGLCWGKDGFQIKNTIQTTIN
jgi:hypothetical protein